jgi:hypothetical protein
MLPETHRSSRPCFASGAAALLVAALLAGCSTRSGPPLLPGPDSVVTPPAVAPVQPAPTPVIPADATAAPVAAAASASGPTAPERPDPLAAALAYADFLRSLSPSELQAELVALAEPGAAPLRQMQLALLLMQSHQGTDTARAQALLQRLLGSTGEGAAELRPLARLLLARLQYIRRLDEQSERQTQQLREAQRRIEVLTDRLEAMRAIERSLSPRTPPATSRPPAP